MKVKIISKGKILRSHVLLGNSKTFSSKKRDLKGISLPLNAIIIIAIALIALAVLGSIFLSSSFGGISQTESQRVFSSGCTRYCKPSLYQTFAAAYSASQNDPDFMKACTALGYGPPVNKCLERCGNCNLNVTQNDLNRGMDNLNELTTR